MTSYRMSYNATDTTDGANGNTTTPYNTEIYSDIIGYPGVRYTLITLHICLSVVAVIGNAVVLILIYKRQSLRRNPTIIFIINLAFIDLVQCAFYRPLQLVDLFMPFSNDGQQDYKYGENYCKTMTFFQCVFAGVGFHTIVAISQERLCLIVYPLKAKHWFSTSRARKLLILIWIVSIGIIMPIPLMFARIIKVDVSGSLIKYCMVSNRNTSGIVYFVAMALIYFFIPFVVISFSYTRIFSALYHRDESLDSVHEKKDFRSLRLRRNLAKMMVAVAVIFVCCWGPHFIFYIYAGTGGPLPSNGFFIATIMDILPIVSSCLNPFVYTLNSRTFRKGLTDMVLRSSFSSRRSYQESVQNTFAGGSPYNRQSSVNYQATDSMRNSRKISLIGSRTKGDVMM